MRRSGKTEKRGLTAWAPGHRRRLPTTAPSPIAGPLNGGPGSGWRKSLATLVRTVVRRSLPGRVVRSFGYLDSIWARLRGGVVLLQLHRFWKCVLTRAGYSYDLGDIWWLGVGVLVSFARGGSGMRGRRCCDGFGCCGGWCSDDACCWVAFGMAGGVGYRVFGVSFREYPDRDVGVRT